MLSFFNDYHTASLFTRYFMPLLKIYRTNPASQSHEEMAPLRQI